MPPWLTKPTHTNTDAYIYTCLYIHVYIPMYLGIWVGSPGVYTIYVHICKHTHINCATGEHIHTCTLRVHWDLLHSHNMHIHTHTHTYALYAYTHAPYPYTCTCTIRLHIHVYAYMPCTYTCTYRVWVYECVACPLCRAYVQCGLCDVLRSSDWAWCHNMQWSCYLAMTRMHVFLVSFWLAAS